MTERYQPPRWQQVAAALGKAACYLGLFLGWQIVVTMVFTTAITMDMTMSGQAVDEWAVYDAVVAQSMEISLLSDLLTLGSVVVLFAIRHKRLDREVWLRPAPKTVACWGMGLAFCLYWLVSLVLSGLPEEWTSSYAEASNSLEQTGVLAFLATAIVAPVVEEVLFRGLIFTRLRRVMPGWAAIVASAAVFGACHGELIWFCYAFLLGVLFALMVEMTGSILPGLLMHLVFNTTNEVFALVLEATGNLGVDDGSSVLYVVFRAVLPFFLATVGTALCAVGLRNALKETRPTTGAGEYPQAQTAAPAVSETQMTVAVAASEMQSREERCPAGAFWDCDSGPNHKFPPQRM